MSFCFFLRWGNGRVLYLHPFLKHSFWEDFRRTDLIPLCHYNVFPSSEELAKLRSILYTQVKKFYHAAQTEKTFLKSFVLAAVTFLLVFYFLSIGIRDPIPMVDELVGAVVASFVVFFVYKKKFVNKIEERKELEVLLSRIDRIELCKNDTFILLGNILNDYYDLPIDHLQQFIRQRDGAHKFPQLTRELQIFYQQLAQYFDHPEQKKLAKLQSKMWGRKAHDKTIAFDMPLYVLFCQLGYNYSKKTFDK